MSGENKNLIYSNHETLIDKIIIKKRQEIINIINSFLEEKKFYDILDIGTTEDKNHKSSNFIIKNIEGFKIFKSISDQNIDSPFFNEKLKKSITDNFNEFELDKFKSDLVISNATIEHVGTLENQIKMCENIRSLTKKYFIIITPNRFHPLEFHTKLPFLHWLPKKIHRFLLQLIGYKILSKEKNLNLLSKKDLIKIMKMINVNKFEIKYINFLFFKSNLILIGQKN